MFMIPWIKATTRTAITRLHPRQSERVFNSGGARKGGKRCLQRVAISNPQIGKAHSAISTGGVFLAFSRFIGQAFPGQRGRREFAPSVMGHSSRLSQANSLSCQSTMGSRVALKQVKHDPAGRGRRIAVAHAPGSAAPLTESVQFTIGHAAALGCSPRGWERNSLGCIW